MTSTLQATPRSTTGPNRRLLLAALFSALTCALRGEPAPYTGQPYAGHIAVIPGVVQAEAYDIAPHDARDITFHYDGQPRQSPWRASADSVGLAGFGTGHVSIDGKPEAPDQVYVGWTQVGEWWKYTVKVTAAGTYQIGGHFSSGSADTRLAFTFVAQTNGGAVIATGALPIPTTAGHQPGVEVYHVWETLTDIGEVNLPAGVYILKVEVVHQAGINLDYFTFQHEN